MIGGARSFGRGAGRKTKRIDVVEELRKASKPLKERQAEYVENHLAMPADVPALDAVDAMEKAIEEIETIKRERDDLQHIFNLQQSRLDDLNRIWRDETGRHDVTPDLGELLLFLVDRTSAMVDASSKEVEKKDLEILALKQVISTAEMAIRGTQLEFALLNVNGPTLGQFLNNSLRQVRVDA